MTPAGPAVRPGLPATPGGLIYGGDYNPDQWPEEVWLDDVRLMREARVNLVSLGVFAWSRLERAPGSFDFEWLDRALNLLHANGVSVNLATPTAAPPPWLVALHPEILPVSADGVTLRVGSRRHYCPHAPAYREAARRIAHALAERYRSHPALALWHVDNEYSCHIGECFCGLSKAAFRVWLEGRYATLDALNRAWATTVWSQIYSAWDEIEPPAPLPAPANPSQELDWRRFWSESWVDCFLEQKAILREVTPGVPVTTNFMCFQKAIDYWALAAVEDIVANDAYPDTGDAEWMIETAMAADLMRSLGAGRPWLLMEQAVSFATWRQKNSTKRPGVMRLGSYQAIGRGADGVMFFQWRAAPAGAEMHMPGLVGHGGTANRQWREVASLGAELESLAELRGSRVQASVAILFDWDNWWALESEAGPTDLRLMPHIRALYKALYRRGLTVDFAPPESDLSRYGMVVAPHLYLLSDAAADNLRGYVGGGGHLLMSFYSGIADPEHHIRLGGFPAPLRELLGLTVEEWAPFAGSMTNAMRTPAGRLYACHTWAEVVRLDGAEAIATFESDFYAGSPAATRHTFGKGSATYLATAPEDDGLAWIVDETCRVAGLPAPATRGTGASAAPGVEVLRRRAGGQTWLFALNYSDVPVDVPLDAAGIEVLSGRPVKGSVCVAPADVAIVRATEAGAA